MFVFLCRLIHGKHDWEHRVNLILFGNYWRCKRCGKSVSFSSMPDDTEEILKRNREESRLYWEKTREAGEREARQYMSRYKRIMMIARHRARKRASKRDWCNVGQKMVPKTHHTCCGIEN